MSDNLKQPQQKLRDNKVVTAEELLNIKVEKMPCLLEPILQKVGLAAITGSSDSSKSSFLRDLAVAICTGQQKYLEWDICAKYKSVIYVSTEDDQYSIAYLLNKQNAQRGLKAESYKNLRYIFNTENLLQTLEEALQVQRADVIIIDAFSDLFSGSINDSTQVRSFLNQYNLLAQKYKCLILWLHHTGKRTDDLIPSKHNLLGSQGFEAKMRVVIELRKDKNNPTLRHFCIVKGNYLPEEYKSKSYVLQFSQHMTFDTTGKRVPIEMLRHNSNQEEQIKEAEELSKQGLSQQQIAQQMGFANKSSISRLLAKSNSN